MIAPEPTRSVPRSRAAGCSDGIPAFTCTVVGSTRPMRLTAAFTAAHARRDPRGTQGCSHGVEAAQPVDGRHAAAHADALARRERVEDLAVVRKGREEAPIVVESTDREAAQRGG